MVQHAKVPLYFSYSFIWIVGARDAWVGGRYWEGWSRGLVGEVVDVRQVVVVVDVLRVEGVLRDVVKVVGGWCVVVYVVDYHHVVVI